jgi:hypothetical protein
VRRHPRLIIGHSDAPLAKVGGRFVDVVNDKAHVMNAWATLPQEGLHPGPVADWSKELDLAHAGFNELDHHIVARDLDRNIHCKTKNLAQKRERIVQGLHGNADMIDAKNLHAGTR